MLVTIDRLIDGGLIDPAYRQILSYEKADLENTLYVRPDLTCRESEIVLGLGLLKTKNMVKFINEKMNYGYKYELKKRKS